MTDKLKPCPFCGGIATVYKTSSYYSNGRWGDNWEVKCTECNMGSMNRYSSNGYRDINGKIVIEHYGKQDAIEAWNRRVEQ